MKLLINATALNHLKVISANLDEYDEAFFAIAFLKVSGLNKILVNIRNFVKAGGAITIIAGQNFALTEPEALNTLRKLFEPFPEAKIYLAKANMASSVFHPKIYLFKKKQRCCIIAGSANITEGGLVNNKEVSLVTECNDKDSLWSDAIKYIRFLCSPDNADEAGLLVIKQYETFFEQQKKNNRKAKPIPTKTKSQLQFNYSNLLNHFKNFNNRKRMEYFASKTNNYAEAKEILDKIADEPSLTQKQFEPLLDRLVGSKDTENLWHSGSLFRLRRKVYKYSKEFREVVKYIRAHKDNSPAFVFENAKKKMIPIEGAAENYVAEIMMTYNPDRFANLNKNPITVLRKVGGVRIKASATSFTGRDYEEYCELVKEISGKMDLVNMLEADSFFNGIYWNIKKS